MSRIAKAEVSGKERSSEITNAADNESAQLKKIIVDAE